MYDDFRDISRDKKCSHFWSKNILGGLSKISFVKKCGGGDSVGFGAVGVIEKGRKLGRRGPRGRPNRQKFPSTYPYNGFTTVETRPVGVDGGDSAKAEK